MRASASPRPPPLPRRPRKIRSGGESAALRDRPAVGSLLDLPSQRTRAVGERLPVRAVRAQPDESALSEISPPAGRVLFGLPRKRAGHSPRTRGAGAVLLTTRLAKKPTYRVLIQPDISCANDSVGQCRWQKDCAVLASATCGTLQEFLTSRRTDQG